MVKNITKEREVAKSYLEDKPSKDALKIILAYSAATKVVRLENQKILINLN